MDIPEKYKKLWRKWDVRILIMVSLAIQIVLIFLGRLRKTSASRAWIRMAVWSNYLLANWVADFVLGQLSSSMDDNSNNAILAFWAPFLLLHLGGPDTITAYSMEDNELWARHLLGLAYELIIAVYVLFRSLPSNLLLAPTLLIFFVAIVKYAERSYSLYRASTDGFRSSVVISSMESQLNQISSKRRTMVARVQDENDKDELNALKGAFEMYSVCKPFFVDVIPLVEVYKVIGDKMKEMAVKEVLELTSMELSYAYDEMYTKAVVSCSRAGFILRVICSSCILLAFLLFVFSPKHGFDTTDVTITYVLLGASICLDTVASLMFLLSDWLVIFLLEFKKLGKWGLLLAQLILRIRRRLWRERRWRPSEMRNATSQPRKLVSRDNPKIKKINKWARRIESKLRRPIRAFQKATVLFPSWTSGFLSYTLNSQKSVKATQHLLKLVTANAQKRLHISWGMFNDKAGLAALRQVDAPIWVVPAFLNMTEGLSADQQVLLWHIATQLCYHWKPQELHPLHHPYEPQAQFMGLRVQKSNWRELQACKCLSDYMLYLVLMRPETMATMGGASTLIYWHAFYDMVQFIQQHEGDLTAAVNGDDEIEGKACRLMLTEPIEWNTYPSLFHLARVLAHLILVIGEEQRWQVITSAWVELLMQGAKNTRASMHVKQLSRGGDLLTFIWLLMKHVGMVDALDGGGYMTGGALDTAKQLPSLIRPYLRNRRL